MKAEKKVKNYDHKKIEPKWQKVWEKKKTNKIKENSKLKKFYGLVEFPYPSGAGLHVGHVRSNTAMDIICRKRRREGYNVLYPMGWDAFGLPTESYAIKTGIQPIIVTKKNTDTFRKQLKMLGFSFDWSKEINTTDPKYYKWTQWIFLQMFKKGLAYKKKMTINWCPKDLIGLANEEVVNGCCEKCGTRVEKKDKEQWMLAITKYADRLDKDLDDVNFLEKIKIQQRNWIGRSEGSELSFNIAHSDEKIKVFTTRPDTIFGVTYVVVAPEHDLVQKLKPQIKNWSEVEKYIKTTAQKTEIDRTDDNKEKTGIELKGIEVKHPITKQIIPLFISDYVLAHYGTGAVMAVPAHDTRDYAFAKKYNLPIKEVISGGDVSKEAFCEDGVMTNSGEFTGRKNTEVMVDITDFVGGERKVTYKLKDWVFSRQRYWGEPIPLVNCAKCGIVPIPEKDLPLILPKVKSYEPTGTGESPLAAITKWVNTKCPVCKGKATRETDTMPNWAGSSWYYLRYIDPKNNKSLADFKKLKYWTPVDWYNGGMEHTTLHLLYSRFWHKFLFDIGVVPTHEPYMKRTAHGMILAEGGEKMSKSRGNVVNPDEIVATFGADSFRLYEMFMGPFDQSITWDGNNIVGSRRFIERVWKLQDKLGTNNNDKINIFVNQNIKKVSEDIEGMRFNTAISSMMILINEFEKEEKISKWQYEMLLLLLAPFAPHVTEEIWANLGHKKSIHLEKWSDFDPNKIEVSDVTIAIQINGKMRGAIVVDKESTQKEVEDKAFALPEIQKWLNNVKPRKIIYIKNKILSLVI
ncbi:MAG: leucine--tRNA ligase [Minisyncoccia bacterium]